MPLVSFSEEYDFLIDELNTSNMQKGSGIVTAALLRVWPKNEQYFVCNYVLWLHRPGFWNMQ